MSERAHVEEWLIGGDLQRKCGLGGLPGDVLDEAGPACDSVDRVKDAQPEAVPNERGACPAGHRKRDRAVVLPGDVG